MTIAPKKKSTTHGAKPFRSKVDKLGKCWVALRDPLASGYGVPEHDPAECGL